MRYRVLGPVEVRVDDDELDVGSRQQRLVLAGLLAAAGRHVPPDRLIEMLWGELPPRSALGTLQTYVSRLRKQLALVGDGSRLSFDQAGYRLEVDRATVDFRRFEQLADEGRSLLDGGQPDAAAQVLSEALGLWRGSPFPELAHHEATRGLIARLEERRLTAIEDRTDALLRIGRLAEVLAELRGLVVEHPFREDLHARLALALYASGRQADALDAISDARRTLRDELGIDPGRALQDLEARILAQDPALELSPTVPDAPPPEPGPQRPATPVPAPSGLVGRDAELRLLHDAWVEAASEARFVVVEGEPGIGKTRLVEEFRSLAVARGSLAVWGRADESGAAPALWPWLPILRAVRTDTPDLAAFDGLLSGEAPVLAGRGAAVRFEAFEAVAQQLEVAGTRAPVVVLIDDLQWADETSLALVRALIGRLRSGVLLVATVRPRRIGGRDAVSDTLGAIAESPRSRRIQLRGLTEADTATLLADTGLVGDAEASERIHARAEGNPFYAIELARLLDGGAATAQQEVPATVRDVIQRRLGRLPAATQDLLAVAAVTGRDVDLHLLARAAGLDTATCLELLDPASTERVIVEYPDRPGSVSFSHALVREVLAGGLTSLQRARLHLAVADAIELGGAGRDYAEIVAEHLWRAAPIGVGRRAAEALEVAAEVALHRVSYTSAEDLLGRAVQLRRSAAASDEDLRAELAALVRLLEVMQTTRYFQGTDRAVLARAQELAARFGPDALTRTLAWFEWAALSTAGKVGESAALARRAIEETAAETDPAVRFPALAMAGTSSWQQGDFAEAVRQFDVGLGLLAELPPPSDALEAEQRMVTASFRIVNHGFCGDWTPDEVHAAFLALMEGVPPLAVPPVCALGGATAACLGPWEAIEVYVDRAVAADPASKFAFWGGAMGMLRGLVEAHAGRVDEGLAAFAAGREQYVALGARTSLANYLAWMGVLTVRAGRLEVAEQLVSDARRERGEEGWVEVMVRIAEAALARGRREHATATAALTSAHDLAVRQQAHGLVRRVRDIGDVLDITLAEPVPG
jgi:DNA-binding SARP family transcriptional activator